MNFLGKAIKSNLSVRTFKPNHGLPFSFLHSQRHFSAEADQPPADSLVDSFLRSQSTGLVYGKLFGATTKYTLKTDIVNLLEGCNLTPDDIKFSYNIGFLPTAMMVQFPSRNEYDTATRVIGKKGRLYRLDRADRSEWDMLRPYDGKTVVLLRLPQNATRVDVERFLSSCDYDTSSIELNQSQSSGTLPLPGPGNECIPYNEQRLLPQQSSRSASSPVTDSDPISYLA